MKIEEKYLINEGWSDAKKDFIKNKKYMRLVHKVSKELHYDIWQTAAFVIELMDDVNMHPEAKYIERYFDSQYLKFE